MDVTFSPEEDRFRAEVREFFESRIPASLRRKAAEGRAFEKADTQAAMRIVHAKGWAVPAWSREWGGTDWTPVQSYIFREEMYRAGVPEPHSINVSMIGPVLIAFGTDAQKQRLLPRIASHDEWWCQGFSEPGAGSDLASLRTAAKRDGDHYVVNGQKIWTSQSYQADWMFCLVRTDPEAKKQRGITMLLIDMRTPGLTVRRIPSIDGGAHLTEVFFDDVRVPVDMRVGEENRGWDYARFLLGHERTHIARVGLAKARLGQVKAIAARRLASGDRSLEAPVFKLRLAWLEAELIALEMTQLRVITTGGTHHGDKADPVTSVLKLKGSELNQAAQSLLLAAAGRDALRDPHPALESDDTDPAWESRALSNYAFTRAMTIFGGTSEVQRNIIARMVFGATP
ncbi:acyl-CoA dehydrogenase family protein [Ramlibacter sp.]|uniref:acyl-CoA dehydrogenase family protein n=1 Tax=Ramlibacter sp. TaxID=1917967 RepID=UPI003D0AD8FD